MIKLSALVAIVTVTLSGCAMQQGDFPSLQKRPYEDEQVVEEPVAPIPDASVLPASVQGSLDAAVAASAAAHAQFLQRLPDVQKRVAAARGAAVSSESWVVAQMELASLERQRSPSVEAVADIDALYRVQLERESVSGQTGGAAIIAGQRDAVQAQVDRQRAEIDALTGRLR